MTATLRRWLERDTGPAGIQRGSLRWAVGLTILVGGIVLVVSVFLDWVHIAIGGVVQASVSGVGTVSVTKPQDDPELQRYAAHSLDAAVSQSGVWIAVIGVLIVAVDAGYLWLLPRVEAAIAVALLAGIGAVFCLSRVINVQRIFRATLDSNYAHYSLGFGLVVACTVTIILTGLGMTAFVLDCVAAVS